jgi:hypothetical protein
MALDTALELFNPHPAGISDVRLIETKLLLRILVGIIDLIILLISLSLAKLFVIPEKPGSNVIFAFTFREIPRVEPFPVAIALMMEMAPKTVEVQLSFFNYFGSPKIPNSAFFIALIGASILVHISNDLAA